MRRQVEAVVVMLVTIFLGLLGLAVFTHTAYQVHIVSPTDTAFDGDMSRLGRDGWKPVTCRRATGDHDVARYECVVARSYRTFGAR